MPADNYIDLIETSAFAGGSGARVSTPSANEIAQGNFPSTTAYVEFVNYNINDIQAKRNQKIKEGIPVWQKTTPYVAGDVVTYGEGAVYMCTATGGSTNQPPTENPSSWESVFVTGSGLLLKANNLSDVANKVSAFNEIRQAATTGATGTATIATIDQMQAGTATNVYITPSVLKQYLSGKSSVPTGAMVFNTWGSLSTQIDGFLPCIGSAISRTTYANLFAEIGTTYGAGDGSTTFNIPNFQGQFVRGIGGNANALGSQQLNAVIDVNGTFSPAMRSGFVSNTKNGVFANSVASTSGNSRENNVLSYYDMKFSWASVLNIQASEVRPTNMSAVAFIKY